MGEAEQPQMAFGSDDECSAAVCAVRTTLSSWIARASDGVSLMHARSAREGCGQFAE